MNMRKSKVLKKIRNGETAFCTKLNLCEPRVAEIAAMSGIDCIWIDMEHVPSDYNEIENLIRAAKVYDCDVLTRISRTGGYSDIIRPLEADSTGIMVPHVMSLEDAKKKIEDYVANTVEDNSKTAYKLGLAKSFLRDYDAFDENREWLKNFVNK